MAGQLIRAREPFVTVGEIARMGLLSSVGADMAGLVLETEEGLVAEVALVRTSDLL